MRGLRFGAVMTSCVLLCFGVAGCSTIQSETDEDAAKCADYAVPDALRKELGSRGLISPTARADAAQTWFSETMPTDISIGGHWVVRWRRGTRFRVDLYRHMESGSLLPPDGGKSASSVACRVYDVAHGVTVQQVDCPKESLDQLP
ncbi:hypothetical protein [Cutibacterium granulosum]|uniref:Uncharacterized protein n=1 Tax=Cutibacterium granulosum TM11 TaxID=1292373 RepID=A0ACB4UQY3_9ACTN|nr:hypothetical protein [Cutibacterium granulosum]ERF67822.1 hypothetical protein H640_00782 [Cutibacterium granulosum TM11]